jgi:hypothetical protein
LLAPGLVGVVRGLNAAARRVGHVGVTLPNQHQARRVGVGKRSKDHRIDDTEDGGIGSDPQRQDRDASERVAGAAPDRAKGVYEIGGHRDIRLGTRKITAVQPHCIYGIVRPIQY